MQKSSITFLQIIFKSFLRPGIVAQAYNSGTQEAMAGTTKESDSVSKSQTLPDTGNPSTSEAETV